MADWSLTKAQALKAAQQIEASANKLRQYSSAYSATRDALLSSWEGSHKDSFAKETANGFDQTAAALANSMQQLAASIQNTAQDMVKRDANAASILKG